MTSRVPWSLRAVAALAITASAAHGGIDLEFRLLDTSIAVGDIANVGLFATFDGAPSGPDFTNADVVLAWDPSVLLFTGVDDDLFGHIPNLASSGFPSPDPFGFNEAPVPTDGDALYQAVSSLVSPMEAATSGTLITTFRFEALQATTATSIDILGIDDPENPLMGIFGSRVLAPGNVNVTGDLSGATFAVTVPSPAPAFVLLAGCFAPRRRRRADS